MANRNECSMAKKIESFKKNEANISKEALINGFKKMREGFIETVLNLDAVKIPERDTEYAGWFNQAIEDKPEIGKLYDNSFAPHSYDELDIASFCEAMIGYLENIKD